MGLWLVPVVICGCSVENLIIISAVPLLSVPSLWANYFRREELVRKVLSESLRVKSRRLHPFREKQRGRERVEKTPLGKEAEKNNKSLFFLCSSE
jgi:hypothetical protein